MSLRDIFFEKVEEDKKETKTKKKIEEPNVQSMSESSVKKSPVVTQPQTFTKTASKPDEIIGQFDKSIFDKLAKELENADLPGPDYFEYKQSLNALASLQMDEGIKYQSAFATLTVSGLNKEKLVNSISHYVEVLDKESKHFEKEVASEESRSVKTQQDSLDDVNETINQKRIKIIELQGEISQLEAKGKTISNAIVESKNRIQTTAANFRVTIQTLINQIKTDEEKIKIFIK